MTKYNWPLPNATPNTDKYTTQFLLDQCRNIFGKIKPDIRKRLEAVIDNPTDKTWDNAYSILLNPGVGLGRTLWQAVIAVDPTFPCVGPALPDKGGPRTPWPRVPSRETLLSAIFHAITETPKGEKVMRQ